MKKLLLAALFAAIAMPQAAEAGLIVAWDDFTNPDNSNAQNAAYTETGFSASFVTDTNVWGRTTSGGLAGLTFGMFDSSTATGTGEYDNVGGQHLSLNSRAVGHIDITVTNSTADDYVLDTLRFDHGATRPDAARTWTVSVQSGALTVGEVGTGGPIDHGGGPTAWTDVDQSLLGLADNTLEAGQTAVFRVALSGSTGTRSHHAYLDNIAITGSSLSAVPEPSSLTLVGLSAMVVLFRRRDVSN